MRIVQKMKRVKQYFDVNSTFQVSKIYPMQTRLANTLWWIDRQEKLDIWRTRSIEHEEIQFGTKWMHDDWTLFVFWFSRRVLVFWNYFVKFVRVNLETLETPKQPPIHAWRRVKKTWLYWSIHSKSTQSIHNQSAHCNLSSNSFNMRCIEH